MTGEKSNAEHLDQWFIGHITKAIEVEQAESDVIGLVLAEGGFANSGCDVLDGAVVDRHARLEHRQPSQARDADSMPFLPDLIRLCAAILLFQERIAFLNGGIDLLWRRGQAGSKRKKCKSTARSIRRRNIEAPDGRSRTIWLIETNGNGGASLTGRDRIVGAIGPASTPISLLLFAQPVFPGGSGQLFSPAVALTAGPKS